MPLGILSKIPREEHSISIVSVVTTLRETEKEDHALKDTF